ncbi:hypothetical protein OG874_32280 [Nocardia sp. NBC_00565]|uniref:hypothetical protein n=1 Tax=Nocardia sp. NBC_00565 TaxID=2975993 RepID=UPI002E813799|nr:hypothetical protein [Nocardia sp. NBC_00565]WUC01446.1 hypothetical protein OG874_32280 [Nocardia sp. NBC_00565]
MSEIVSPGPNEIAPTVRALLAAFHTDTASKLELAPLESTPICQRSDGSLCRVDEDGWISDSDLDKVDAITIMPTSVVDKNRERE